MSWNSKKSLAVSVIALSGLAVAGAAQAAEKIKITMAASSNNYAPYYAAIAKGYFKEEGFDVEVVKAGGGTATPALISGSVHFSTSGASALSAILRGANLKLVFFPWDRPTYQIWSTTPEITRLDQIKGKAVGIQTRGDTFEVALRQVLMRHNIDPNSISYTPLGYGGGRRAAIASGSLPVAVLSRIDVLRLKASDGLKKGKMIFDMYNFVRMPYTGVAVRDKDIKADRDRIKRFVRASIKGLAFMAAFKDATLDIVQGYNKRTPRKALSFTYDDVRATKTADGTVDDKAQQEEVNIRAEILGIAKSRIRPLGEIFDFSMAHEVNRELKAAGWKPTL